MKKSSYFALLSIVCFTCLSMCAGCGYVPQLLQEAEHVADDTAVKLEVSQEALRKDTNVEATIRVINSKSEPKQP